MHGYDGAGDARERHETTRFLKHRSLDQLEMGIKNDIYVSGQVSVSKFRPRCEAVVKAGKAQGDDVCSCTALSFGSCIAA